MSILILNSKNKKLGKKAAATYLPFSTCPKSCRFRNSACYAMSAMDTRRVANNVEKHRSYGDKAYFVYQECLEITEAVRLKKHEGMCLRLHVSGDVVDVDTIRALAEAANQWETTGGGKVWTYTHRWSLTPAGSWWPISVLASIDGPHQREVATSMGYACALVVPNFRENSLPQVDFKQLDWGDDWMWVPCPAQTQTDRTCESCRLCWNAEKLRKTKRGIVFAAHGPNVGKQKMQKLSIELLGIQQTLFEE